MGSAGVRGDAGTRLPDDRQRLAAERRSADDRAALATDAAASDAADADEAETAASVAAGDAKANSDTAAALEFRTVTPAPNPAADESAQTADQTPAVGTCMVIVTPRFRPVVAPQADPVAPEAQPVGTCQVEMPTLPTPDKGDTAGDDASSGDIGAGDAPVIPLTTVGLMPPLVADPIVPTPVAAGDGQVRTIATILAGKAGSPRQPTIIGVDVTTGDQPDSTAIAAAPVKPAVILPVQPQTTPDAATLQAIAALIRSATDKSSDSGASIADDKALVGTIQATAAQAIAPRAEPPVAAAPAPVIDTRRAEWMEALIDRIDDQRGHGGRSLHISLSPDALGGVEVRMRQEGDRVHIAFSTDTAQARALLADAAPRLAQLADARGLKLGDTGVEQNPQDRRQGAPDQTQLPDAPASGLTTDSDDPADALSDRLA
jgi:flagellar hook-length control protein FliK